LQPVLFHTLHVPQSCRCILPRFFFSTSIELVVTVVAIDVVSCAVPILHIPPPALNDPIPTVTYAARTGGKSWVLVTSDTILSRIESECLPLPSRIVEKPGGLLTIILYLGWCFGQVDCGRIWSMRLLKPT